MPFNATALSAQKEEIKRRAGSGNPPGNIRKPAWPRCYIQSPPLSLECRGVDPRMTDRTIRRAGVVTVFVVVLALVWFTRKVWLLLFAGLLVALVLTSLINFLKRLLHVGHKIGLVLAQLILAGLATGIVFLVTPTVSGQFAELSEAIPQRMGELRQKINDSVFIQKMNNSVPEISQPAQGAGATGGTGGVTKLFTSTFEAASSFLFILFTGIFAAATPALYRRMVVKLFAPRVRPKAEHTIDRIICTLRHWLLGQGIAMLVVGIVTGGALAIAGVPFAAALGIVAAFLEFIPVIGPILSAVPAVLLAFANGLNKVLISNPSCKNAPLICPRSSRSSRCSFSAAPSACSGSLWPRP